MSDSAFILGGFRQMSCSDVQGGSVSYGGVTFPATVGIFDVENPLAAAGGGHSPRLLGIVEIANEDFPFPAGLATDQEMDVTDGAGVVRYCRVVSWTNLGPLWQVTVADLNQGA